MGEVRLSTREYEELIAVKIKMEQAISIRKNWYDEPVVHIDIRPFDDIIRDKFNASEFTKTHTIEPQENSGWLCEAVIIKEKPVKEEVDENGSTEEGL